MTEGEGRTMIKEKIGSPTEQPNAPTNTDAVNDALKVKPFEPDKPEGLTVNGKTPKPELLPKGTLSEQNTPETDEEFVLTAAAIQDKKGIANEAAIARVQQEIFDDATRAEATRGKTKLGTFGKGILHGAKNAPRSAYRATFRKARGAQVERQEAVKLVVGTNEVLPEQVQSLLQEAYLQDKTEQRATMSTGEKIKDRLLRYKEEATFAIQEQAKREGEMVQRMQRMVTTGEPTAEDIAFAQKHPDLVNAYQGFYDETLEAKNEIVESITQHELGDEILDKLTTKVKLVGADAEAIKAQVLAPLLKQEIVRGDSKADATARMNRSVTAIEKFMRSDAGKEVLKHHPELRDTTSWGTDLAPKIQEAGAGLKIGMENAESSKVAIDDAIAKLLEGKAISLRIADARSTEMADIKQHAEAEIIDIVGQYDRLVWDAELAGESVIDGDNTLSPASVDDVLYGGRSKVEKAKQVGRGTAIKGAITGTGKGITYASTLAAAATSVAALPAAAAAAVVGAPAGLVFGAARGASEARRKTREAIAVQNIGEKRGRQYATVDNKVKEATGYVTSMKDMESAMNKAKTDLEVEGPTQQAITKAITTLGTYQGTEQKYWGLEGTNAIQVQIAHAQLRADLRKVEGSLDRPMLEEIAKGMALDPKVEQDVLAQIQESPTAGVDALLQAKADTEEVRITGKQKKQRRKARTLVLKRASWGGVVGGAAGLVFGSAAAGTISYGSHAVGLGASGARAESPTSTPSKNVTPSTSGSPDASASGSPTGSPTPDASTSPTGTPDASPSAGDDPGELKAGPDGGREIHGIDGELKRDLEATLKDYFGTGPAGEVPQIHIVEQSGKQVMVVDVDGKKDTPNIVVGEAQGLKGLKVELDGTITVDDANGDGRRDQITDQALRKYFTVGGKDVGADNELIHNNFIKLFRETDVLDGEDWDWQFNMKTKTFDLVDNGTGQPVLTNVVVDSDPQSDHFNEIKGTRPGASEPEYIATQDDTQRYLITETAGGEIPDAQKATLVEELNKYLGADQVTVDEVTLKDDKIIVNVDGKEDTPDLVIDEAKVVTNAGEQELKIDAATPEASLKKLFDFDSSGDVTDAEKQEFQKQRLPLLSETVEAPDGSYYRLDEGTQQFALYEEDGTLIWDDAKDPTPTKTGEIKGAEAGYTVTHEADGYHIRKGAAATTPTPGATPTTPAPSPTTPTPDATTPAPDATTPGAKPSAPDTTKPGGATPDAGQAQPKTPEPDGTINTQEFLEQYGTSFPDEKLGWHTEGDRQMTFEKGVIEHPPLAGREGDVFVQIDLPADKSGADSIMIKADGGKLDLSDPNATVQVLQFEGGKPVYTDVPVSEVKQMMGADSVNYVRIGTMGTDGKFTSWATNEGHLNTGAAQPDQQPGGTPDTKPDGTKPDANPGTNPDQPPASAPEAEAAPAAEVPTSPDFLKDGTGELNPEVLSSFQEKVTPLLQSLNANAQMRIESDGTHHTLIVDFDGDSNTPNLETPIRTEGDKLFLGGKEINLEKLTIKDTLTLFQEVPGHDAEAKEIDLATYTTVTKGVSEQLTALEAKPDSFRLVYQGKGTYAVWVSQEGKGPEIELSNVTVKDTTITVGTEPLGAENVLPGDMAADKQYVELARDMQAPEGAVLKYDAKNQTYAVVDFKSGAAMVKNLTFDGKIVSFDGGEYYQAIVKDGKLVVELKPETYTAVEKGVTESLHEIKGFEKAELKPDAVEIALDKPTLGEPQTFTAYVNTDGKPETPRVAITDLLIKPDGKLGVDDAGTTIYLDLTSKGYTEEYFALQQKIDAPAGTSLIPNDTDGDPTTIDNPATYNLHDAQGNVLVKDITLDGKQVTGSGEKYHPEVSNGRVQIVPGPTPPEADIQALPAEVKATLNDNFQRAFGEQTKVTVLKDGIDDTGAKPVQQLKLVVDVDANQHTPPITIEGATLEPGDAKATPPTSMQIMVPDPAGGSAPVAFDATAVNQMINPDGATELPTAEEVSVFRKQVMPVLTQVDAPEGSTWDIIPGDATTPASLNLYDENGDGLIENARVDGDKLTGTLYDVKVTKTGDRFVVTPEDSTGKGVDYQAIQTAGTQLQEKLTSVGLDKSQILFDPKTNLLTLDFDGDRATPNLSATVQVKDDQIIINGKTVDPNNLTLAQVASLFEETPGGTPPAEEINLSSIGAVNKTLADTFFNVGVSSDNIHVQPSTTTSGEFVATITMDTDPAQAPHVPEIRISSIAVSGTDVTIGGKPADMTSAMPFANTNADAAVTNTEAIPYVDLFTTTDAPEGAYWAYDATNGLTLYDKDGNLIVTKVTVDAAGAVKGEPHGYKITGDANNGYKAEPDAGTKPVPGSSSGPGPSGTPSQTPSQTAPAPSGAVPTSPSQSAPAPGGAAPTSSSQSAPAPSGAAPTSSSQSAPAPSGAAPTSSSQSAPAPGGAAPTSSSQSAPAPSGAAPTSSSQSAPAPGGAAPTSSSKTAPAPSTTDEGSLDEYSLEGTRPAQPLPSTPPEEEEGYDYLAPAVPIVGAGVLAAIVGPAVYRSIKNRRNAPPRRRPARLLRRDWRPGQGGSERHNSVGGKRGREVQHTNVNGIRRAPIINHLGERAFDGIDQRAFEANPYLDNLYAHPGGGTVAKFLGWYKDNTTTATRGYDETQPAQERMYNTLRPQVEREIAAQRVRDVNPDLLTRSFISYLRTLRIDTDSMGTSPKNALHINPSAASTEPIPFKAALARAEEALGTLVGISPMLTYLSNNSPTSMPTQPSRPADPSQTTNPPTFGNPNAGQQTHYPGYGDRPGPRRPSYPDYPGQPDRDLGHRQWPGPADDSASTGGPSEQQPPPGAPFAGNPYYATGDESGTTPAAPPTYGEGPVYTPGAPTNGDETSGDGGLDVPDFLKGDTTSHTPTGGSTTAPATEAVPPPPPEPSITPVPTDDDAASTTGEAPTGEPETGAQVPDPDDEAYQDRTGRNPGTGRSGRARE